MGRSARVGGHPRVGIGDRQGQSGVDPELLTALLGAEHTIEIDLAKGAVRTTGASIALRDSPLLHRLLAVLAESIGARVANETIARRLWPREYHPARDDRLVWAHVRRLRKTLAGTGLTVRNDDEGYWLDADRPVRVSAAT